MPHETAIQRAFQISNISYALSLSLEESKPNYSGSITLNFDFSENDAPLEIDFSNGAIHSITVNQQLSENYEYNKFYILIPSASLKQGHNTVTIEFSHPYSTTGFGLYRFKDPEDNNVFIYSDLEPFEANSVFPCFDQPDLKASYQLSVETPDNWQVISARRAAREEKIEQSGRKIVHFPLTQHFSTYLSPFMLAPIMSGNQITGLSRYDCTSVLPLLNMSPLMNG